MLLGVVVVLTSGQPRVGDGHAQPGETPAKWTAVSPQPDPLLFVLHDQDAPVDITEAAVIRNANHTPAAVRVAFRNRQDIPLATVNIDAFLFNERGGIRLRSTGIANRGIGALAAGAVDMIVNRLDAKPDWKIVVAASEATFGGRKWQADHLRERAEAMLHEVR